MSVLFPLSSMSTLTSASAVPTTSDDHEPDATFNTLSELIESLQDANPVVNVSIVAGTTHEAMTTRLGPVFFKERESAD